MTSKFAALALFATAVLGSGTMYADSVTVFLGPSSQNYTLLGTGGSGGFGTYLAQQGNCVAGATDTSCILSGSYSGSLAGYTSGTYSLMTTYLNIDGGLSATSSTPVASPDGGNFFFFDPFSSDLNMSLLLNDISGLKTIPMVVNGTFVADSYSIFPVSPACTGLAVGVPCTQGNVGLSTEASIFGPITGRILFTTPAAVPEPEWLALGGLLPGAFVMLRRRFSRPA